MDRQNTNRMGFFSVTKWIHGSMTVVRQKLYLVCDVRIALGVVINLSVVAYLEFIEFIAVPNFCFHFLETRLWLFRFDTKDPTLRVMVAFCSDKHGLR